METQVMAGSTPAYRSELDIFSNFPTDVSVVASDFQAFYPTSSYKENENPLEFYINGNGTHYLDLNSSYLYVKAKIVRQDGTDLIATDKVAPGNLFLSTMFENCYVSANGVQISDSANFYPYQSWIQKQLSFGESFKKTELSSEMYYKDTIGADTYTDLNTGFKSRLDLCAGSKAFELIGRINASIFQQKRYIPNHVDLNVILRRSSPKFALSSSTTSLTGVTGCPYKYIILEAVLYVRKHLLNPIVMRNNEQSFSSGKKALYPIRRTEIKSFALPKGSLGTSGELIFQGALPEILTVGFVDSTAQSGALDKNPFNFQNFKLSQIAITVDNDAAVYRALNFDFANGQYLQGYNTLFRAVGYQSEGNFLERTDYILGNTLFVFDVQPTASGGRFQIPRAGQVKLELKFSEALANPINVIAFGQFQSIIEIDNNRNVYVDTHG
jgi:hypothetical protein